MRKTEKLAQDQGRHPVRLGIGGIVSNLAAIIRHFMYGVRKQVMTEVYQTRLRHMAIYNNLEVFVMGLCILLEHLKQVEIPAIKF